MKKARSRTIIHLLVTWLFVVQGLISFTFFRNSGDTKIFLLFLVSSGVCLISILFILVRTRQNTKKGIDSFVDFNENKSTLVSDIKARGVSSVLNACLVFTFLHIFIRLDDNVLTIPLLFVVAGLIETIRESYYLYLIRKI